MRRALIVVLVGGLAACSDGGYLVPLRDNPGDGDQTAGDGTRLPPNWQPIGTSTSGNGASQHGDRNSTACSRLALDEAGRVYVAWADHEEGYANVYLTASIDGGWVGLGGSNTGKGVSLTSGPTTAESPGGGFYSCPGSMAFDSAGRLYLAWQEFQTTKQVIYVRRWDPELSIWEGIADSDIGNGISAPWNYSWFPSIVIDGAGTPVVGWGYDGEILVRRHRTSWAGLLGSDAPPFINDSVADAWYLTLAADAGETFSGVWYQETATGFDLHGARWDGLSWSALGGSTPVAASVGYNYNPPAIAARASATAVAWTDAYLVGRKIHVAQWEGTWTFYPEVGAPGANDPQVALDADKRPVVVWLQKDGDVQNVHCARWDGAAWLDLDIDANGISRSATFAASPRVAVNLAGTIVVSWQEVLPTHAAIYVLRLDP